MTLRVAVVPGLHGLVASGVVLAVAAVLPAPLRLDLLAAVLFVTVGIYFGFAIQDGRPRAKVVEGAGGLAFGVLALLGLWVSPLFLAIGWLAHPAWDLAHHPHGIRTRMEPWVIPFCLVFDGVVGLAVLVEWVGFP